MSQINFLPQSYRDRLRCRVRRLREAVLVLAVAAGLVAWWAYDANELMKLRESSRFAEDQLQSALSTEQLVNALEDRRAKLVDQRRLQREIRVPIRHHEVIRVIGSLAPESITLTRLLLENDRPEPKPYVPVQANQAANDQPSFGSSPDVESAATPPRIDRIRVELEGLAPDDLAVAETIASLSGHPLFRGVKLHTSRFLETRGVAARSFRMTGEIDLTRSIVWDPADPVTTTGVPEITADGPAQSAQVEVRP